MPNPGRRPTERTQSAAQAVHQSLRPDNRRLNGGLSEVSKSSHHRALPHLPSHRGLPPGERAHVDRAIAHIGLAPLRQRAASRLSGGEQARVLIARALAQDTPLLMADEPAAGLDPAHQISTMEVFAELSKAGRAALVSMHYLSLAARHCTRVLLMIEGRILADGPPAEVLTPDLMARAFGISVWHEQTGQGPVFQPLEVLK